ncbi:acyl carrier protein [Actinoplanes sp. NPDC049316]|uniref:acyl carrier protein n=1 Tax=Actinoplanes sp. NPDC049316 TaxID=3154727 RepID=UPI00341A4EDF
MSTPDRTRGILAIARHVLDRPALTADDDLPGHGATSLSIVRIVAEAHRSLGLDLDPGAHDGVLTVRVLARRATVATPS